MKSIESLAVEMRLARLGRALKQADLARQLAVSQAAISQFERGNTTALSFAKIRQAAEILGVDLDAGEAATPPPHQPLLKFCERPDCLANVRYDGPRRTIVRPRLTFAPAGETTHCAECGDLLLDHCPNDDCGRPVGEGSFCTACGTPYVPLDGGEGRLAPAGGERQSELERIRDLTRTRSA